MIRTVGAQNKENCNKVVVHCSNGRGRKPKVVNESLSEGDIQRRNEVLMRTLEDCRNLGLDYW